MENRENELCKSVTECKTFQIPGERDSVEIGTRIATCKFMTVLNEHGVLHSSQLVACNVAAAPSWSVPLKYFSPIPHQTFNLFPWPFPVLQLDPANKLFDPPYLDSRSLAQVRTLERLARSSCTYSTELQDAAAAGSSANTALFALPASLQARITLWPALSS